MEISPISIKRVYQSVIEQFINLITIGQLKPGDKLPPERSLAERFGVGRTSIREAFRVMELIGIIEVRPGGGSFITDLNITHFISMISPLFLRTESIEMDLLEFRRLLEVEAVRLTAEHADSVAISLLEDAVRRMGNSLSQNESSLGVDADIDFHKAIFSGTCNTILIKAAECVSYFLESSVRLNRASILKNQEHASLLLDQHRRILNAICQHDGQTASEAMTAHLQFVKESIQSKQEASNPNFCE